MLAEFRAEAARERDEMRADLRARTERAEREADAYHAELARVHETTYASQAPQSRADDPAATAAEVTARSPIWTLLDARSAPQP